MNKEEAKQIMRISFEGLSETGKNNLRWHAGSGTPILCKENFLKWTRDDGAG